MPDDDTSTASKPELTIGSYRLLEPLGSGGMSSVFRAVHIESGNEVAVKILPRSLAKNPTMLQRFLREAASAEALEHPNIVSIYDRGVDQGRHYLVLEFVKGGDLHDRVRNEGPLGIAEAVSVIKSVAEGLKYASELGLIHRDIKPANLLLSPTGQVKIIDLGLALKAEDEDERVTRDGTTVGTVDYMAPEQARDSRATSERSDMYSLGCTLYYFLTGSPPFPGGDIADKLSRHCTKAPPDPCEIRPAVPRTLGLLVRKLMAKRPENRFRDYDELIHSLRNIAANESIASEDSMEALVDDDDEGGIPLAPIESGNSNGNGAGMVRGGEPRTSQSSGIELADLADEDSSPAPRRPQPGSTPHAPGRRVADDDPELALDELDESGEGEGVDEDEIVEDLGPGRAAPAADPRSKALTLKWIYAGVGGCVGLLVLVIVINLMIRPAATTPVKGEAETEAVFEAPIAPEPVIAPVAVQAVAPAPPPKPESAPVAQPSPALAVSSSPTAPLTPAVKSEIPATAPTTPARTGSSSWIEPTDTVPEVPADPVIPPAIVARFPVPAWAKVPIPQKLAGTYLKVRRIIEPTNPQERSSLTSAFELIGGGTVELIDDGPFIESDLRLHGGSRLVRAGEGRRPIIRLDAPKLEVVKQQPALFVLDGKSLILDGIDLIVNLQDMPRDQSALFSCKGGALTLNNCTITVLNPKARAFSLIRASGAERPAQIRIEKTFVRGDAIPLLEIIGGGVDVAIVRSVLVGGQGALITSTGNASAGERKLELQNCVLASRGPILELSTLNSSRPAPVILRALDTTFARFRTDTPVSMISLHDDVAGDVKEFINWQGEQNSFRGWNDLASMGSAHAIKVAGLEALRTTWPATDSTSLESANAWPVPPEFFKVLPEQMKSLAPMRVQTLATVAVPSPYLFEKTIEEFKRPELPTFVSPIPNVVVGEEGFPIDPGFNPLPQPGFDASGNPLDPNAPPAIVVKELAFDTVAKPWAGDLGRFLADQVKAGDVRVRVKVSGSGAPVFTPVRLPEGTSLEIIVEATRATGAEPPKWTHSRGVSADALIETRGGDLVLTGVEMNRDASKKLKALLLVEDGHLIVNHCRLQAMNVPGAADFGGGNLIVFRAPTTRPLPSRPWPFDKPFDKPVCRVIDSVLISTGDVLTTEVGRGIIALTECAVAAGGSAFILDASKVARSRFDGDLWLERCTLAAEKQFVMLGAWPGTTPGPDRPWLISSRDCAYVSKYTPPSKESVLLRVEPTSLALGVLFWQGNNDAYEVANFTGRIGKASPPTAHPDVYRQWTSLWGTNHFRTATGPTTRNTPPTVRLPDPLRAGSVTAGDLALDPNDHPGRGELDLGVDLRRLQVVPRRSTRR